MRAKAARRMVAVLLAGASVAACATTGPRPPPPRAHGAAVPGYKTGAPYQVGGIWYVPHEQPGYDESGHRLLVRRRLPA